MRVVFMGTPALAERVLDAVLASEHQVVAVVSQPDRPAGRGKRMVAPPVAARARAEGLPLLQVTSAKTVAFRRWVARHDADIAVVAAFGHILGPKALAVPPQGCINVHASLLPRWRGASPIQSAILAGDDQTGITIMQMDAGMDTGDMLLTRALTLARDETAATLHDRLTALGGAAAVAALDGLAAGTLTRTPQPAAGVSYAPKISKSDAELDWSRAAAALAQQVRAYAPWPGTRTTWEGQVLKIHPPVAVLPGHPSDVVAPGTVVAAGPAGIDVATGRGLLRVMRLQLPNKKALDVDAFVAGRGVRAGMRFGPPTSEGG